MVLSSKNCQFCLNAASREFLFNSVPAEVRAAILRSLRDGIEQVLSVCPGAVLTSGYRSPSYNASLYSGRGTNSLHQYGGAADFRVGTVDVDKLRASGFKVIEEKNCIHVFFKGE